MSERGQYAGKIIDAGSIETSVVSSTFDITGFSRVAVEVDHTYVSATAFAITFEAMSQSGTGWAVLRGLDASSAPAYTGAAFSITESGISGSGTYMYPLVEIPHGKYRVTVTGTGGAAGDLVDVYVRMSADAGRR